MLPRTLLFILNDLRDVCGGAKFEEDGEDAKESAGAWRGQSYQLE